MIFLFLLVSILSIEIQPKFSVLVLCLFFFWLLLEIPFCFGFQQFEHDGLRFDFLYIYPWDSELLMSNFYIELYTWNPCSFVDHCHQGKQQLLYLKEKKNYHRFWKMVSHNFCNIFVWNEVEEKLYILKIRKMFSFFTIKTCKHEYIHFSAFSFCHFLNVPII